MKRMIDGFFVASIVLVLVSITGFIAGAGQSQETAWKAPASADTLKNPFSGDTLALKEGRKIYQSACWTCHGKFGKGDGPAAKGLSKKPADHTSPGFQDQTDGSIFWKISRGKGQMSPYEKIYSRAQRWKLVVFIRSLSINKNPQ